MKIKRSFKRWLSILLVVAISLTTVMPTPVYAAEESGNDVTSSIQSSIEHEMEKEAEGRADAESPNSKTKASQTALTSRILCVPDFNANSNSFPILLRRKMKSISYALAWRLGHGLAPYMRITEQTLTRASTRRVFLSYACTAYGFRAKSNDVSKGCSALTQLDRTTLRNIVLRQATRDFTMLVKSGHSYRPFAFKIQDTCKIL